MLKDRIIDMLIGSNFSVNEKGWPCLRFGVRLIILNDVADKTNLKEITEKFRRHSEMVTAKWDKEE